MTNLVSVPGRNISWSQCGIGLNIEKPRIRYRPSSDFTWMSLITSGVMMLLCPSTALPSPSIVVTCSCASPCYPAGFASASRWLRQSEDELAFGRLEVVVVPELAPAYELAERARRLDAVDAELARQKLVISRRQLCLDAVHAQRGDLPAHIDRAVVHRVAQPAAHVAADDLPAALEHEPRHHARVAADEDGAALLVDARPGPDIAADHHVAAAQRRAGQRPCVLVDEDHAGHHVLGSRPADPAGDVNLRPVDQAAPEVAEAALDADLAAGEDADRDRMLRPGVQDRDVLDALVVHKAAQLEVNLPRGELVRVENCPARLDRRDLGRAGIRLGQPAGVISDLHRFHTSTSRS